MVNRPSINKLYIASDAAPMHSFLYFVLSRTNNFRPPLVVIEMLGLHCHVDLAVHRNSPWQKGALSSSRNLAALPTW